MEQAPDVGRQPSAKLSRRTANHGDMPNAADQIRGPDLRLLRHPDRLGERHLECAPAALGPGRRRRRSGARTRRWKTFAKHSSRRSRRRPPACVYRQALLTDGPSADWRSHWGLRSRPPPWIRDFGGSVPDWPAFPDSDPGADRYLKRAFQAGHPVERGPQRALPPATAAWGLRFDAVYTAQDIGSYKPAAGQLRLSCWST